MGCSVKSLQTRVFHIFLRCGVDVEYAAMGRVHVHVVGEASPTDVLELYAHQNPTDWARGEFVHPRYFYLIQEEGSEVITPLTVEPQTAYTITAE